MLRDGTTNTHFASVTTSDFDELAEAFHRWDNRFRQLGRGPFRGSVQLLQVGGIQIIRVATSRMLHAEGVLPAGSFCCAPILTTNEGAVWRGRRLRTGQVRVLVPGEEMDHVTAAEYQATILLVKESLCREIALQLHGFDPAERLAGRGAISADPSCVSAFCSELSVVLDNVEARSNLLAQPDAAHLLEQVYVRRFLRLLSEVSSDQPGPRPPNCVTLVRRAEEYINSCLPGPLTMFDLCHELAVSERTLHYAFREVRGLSPMAYVKAKKLNAVRQALKAASGATVLEIAGRWGFWHTGEFAADYYRLFGELPSQTLGGRRHRREPLEGS